MNDRRTESRFVQRCGKLRTRPYRAETHCGRGKIRFSAQLVRYNFSGNEDERSFLETKSSSYSLDSRGYCGELISSCPPTLLPPALFPLPRDKLRDRFNDSSKFFVLRKFHRWKIGRSRLSNGVISRSKEGPRERRRTKFPFLSPSFPFLSFHDRIEWTNYYYMRGFEISETYWNSAF